MKKMYTKMGAAARQTATRLCQQASKAGRWLWKHWRREIIVYSVLSCVIFTLFAGAAVTKESIYKNGLALYGNGQYLEAAAQFEKAADYKDAEGYILLCQRYATYTQANALMDKGEYEEARALYASLGDFEDAASRALWCDTLATIPGIEGELRSAKQKLRDDYAGAKRLLHDCNYWEAYSAFTALAEYGYRDSTEKAEESLQGYYSAQHITTIDLSLPENSAYLEPESEEDEPRFFAGNLPVELIDNEYSSFGYRIPGGRMIWSDSATGDLIQQDAAGKTRVLLTGLRTENELHNQSVRFAGMIDSHRFLYDIVSWECQVAVGVYDLTTGADHRFMSEDYDYTFWYPEQLSGNRLIFSGSQGYHPTKIGELNLDSYSFIETELASVDSAFNDRYTYDVQGFSVTPDGERVVLSVSGIKPGQTQLWILSLTDKKTLWSSVDMNLGDVLRYDISPDGTRVAFVTKKYSEITVFTYSLVEGQPEQTYKIAALSEDFCVQYHTDTQLYVYAYGSTDTLYVIGRQQVEIEGCTEVTTLGPEVVDDIIGTIGNTVFVLETEYVSPYTVTITTLDDKTFEEKSDKTLYGDFSYPNYYFKNDRLWLLFKDRVVTLNSDLSIEEETPLPQALLDVQAQQQEDPDFFWWDLWSGYDVSDDYTLWVYTAYNHAFLYSTATEETIRLELTDLPDGCTDTTYAFPHAAPRFSADNKTVYTQEHIMDGMSDAVCAFDVASGKGALITEGCGGDRTGFITPGNAQMGSYFGHIAYYDVDEEGLDFVYPVPSLSLSLAENYYLCKGYSKRPHTVEYFLVGRLDDPNLDHAKKIVPGEGLGWGACAVLADGRVLFVTNPGSNVFAPQVFITAPFSAL